MAEYEDPGWGRAVRQTLPALFLPAIFFFAFVRRRSDMPRLTRLRGVFLHVVVVLFEFLIVLRFLDLSGPATARWYPWLLLAVAASAIFVLVGARTRKLDLSSMDALARSYEATFFVELGVVTAIPLFGFTGVFIANRLWVYPLGMALSAPGLALMAPTETDIRRRQEQIAAQGSSLSLGAALMTAPRGSRKA